MTDKACGPLVYDTKKFTDIKHCHILFPRKITKLEEKYSSPVGYKFTVDESCRNPWLPNRAECLTFENTSTACYNGIVTLQCLEGRVIATLFSFINCY